MRSRMNLLFIWVFSLLLLGLVIDVGINRAAINEVRRLGLYRAQLLDQTNQLVERNLDNQTLAKALKVESLADVLVPNTDMNPVSYIGQQLDNSGLTRLELSTLGVSESDNLRQNRFSLRALGKYTEIMDFVRSVEQGETLATLDAFSIETVVGKNSLEGRFNISVYEPIVRKMP